MLLQRMAATLDDAHAGVRSVGGYIPQTDSMFAAMIPARLARVRGGHVVVVQQARVDDPKAPDGRSFAANPLRVGDEVLRVDGKSFAEITAEWRPLISSPTPGQLEDRLSVEGYYGTLGPGKSLARVEIRTPAGGTRTIVVARNHRGWGFQGQPSRRLPGNLGYLDLGLVRNQRMLDSLETEFTNTDGLVIDARYYRDQEDVYLPNAIRGWLWERPIPTSEGFWEIPMVDFQGGTLSQAQARFHAPQFVPAENNTTGKVYEKPIVMLVGPVWSEAEVLPMEVRETHRGLLVGAPTPGTTGNRVSIPLPGGGAFTFTGVTILNPDSTRYNRHGIKPDIKVEPTVAGIRAERDEVLDAGIAALRGTIAKELAVTHH